MDELRQYFPIVIAILTYIIEGGIAVCNEGSASTWVSIPEEQYDMNFTSIAVDGKRPMGFMKGIVYWNQDTANPCIKVTDSSTKRLEIMAETVPQSKLCYKTQSMAVPLCQQGSISKCLETTANTMVIEFSCDTCDEADVTFWYRFTLSPLPSVLDPEEWCFQRSGSDFPGSLQPVPVSFTIRPVTTQGPSGASHLIPLSVTYVVVLCLFLMMVR